MAVGGAPAAGAGAQAPMVSIVNNALRKGEEEDDLEKPEESN